MARGFQRMDVDVHWVYHRRVRRLQRLYPDRWPCYWAAYMALLGEAWARGSRDLVLDDTMPVALNVTSEEAAGALKAAGMLDSRDRIPKASWDDWFGPAAARMEGYRKAGIASGFARKRTTLERATNDVERTLNPTNQPTNQPTPARPRARGKGQMTPLRDLLPPPPGYEDHES